MLRLLNPETRSSSPVGGPESWIFAGAMLSMVALFVIGLLTLIWFDAVYAWSELKSIRELILIKTS